MAVALLIIGALLVTTGLRGTYPQLGALLVNDFSGSGSFWYFVFGIVIIGSIGNVRQFQEISRLLIALIIVVFMLANKGFWANLQSALANIQTTPPAPVPQTSNANPTGPTPNDLSTTPVTPQSPIPQMAPPSQLFNPFAPFSGGNSS